jgi:NADPH:quinone reductase-like Zn-dependent oxidoreductase
MAEIDKTATDVPQAQIYNALTELGVAYGSTFQGLSDCRADEKHAVANITVADTAAEMPEHYETKHIVHPSFLEQLIQMYWPVLGAGRAALDTVCLPASIGRLTVFPCINKYAATPGQSLRSYCAVDAPLSTQKPSIVSMFAVAGEETVISIEDLTIAPLPASDMDADVEKARDLCYKQIWEPILEPVKQGERDRIDSPQADDKLPTTPICIVHGSSSSQLELARMLAASLENLGVAKINLGVLEEVDTTDKHCISIAELDQFVLATLNNVQFHALQNMIGNSQGLLWVTRGAYGQNGDPTGNMVTGFSRSVRSESMYKFATLDLDAEHKLDDATSIQAMLKVFKVTMGVSTIANTEMEFQEREGAFWTPRIVNDEVVNDYVHKKSFPPAVEEIKLGATKRALKMAISRPGMFDSMHFVDDELKKQDLASDQIEIEVKAVAVTTRDAQVGTGHIDASGFGEQCSGLVTRVGSAVKNLAVGDRVAALASSSFATYARAVADMALKLGPETSFEEAASLPLAQCAAHHALIELARLEDEESVLVLNGAGAEGQAAISLAQTIGATVFTTVNTAEDKTVLMKAFDLPEDRILYSKDDQLSTSVHRAIDGRGIDVVLSVYAEADSIQTGLKCIADFGRFVRLETAEAANKGKLDLSSFRANTSFSSFDIHALAKGKPRVLQRLLKDVSRALRYAKLRPVQDARILPFSQVSEAFKLAQSSPSSNRIVVVPHKDDMVKVTPSKEVVKLFKDDATYILIGGTGGLGRGMSRWMAAKGARHLVLLSRSGKVDSFVQNLIDDVSPLGVQVHVFSCDVAKKEQVDRLFQKLIGLPPIKGVIHGSMVLRASYPRYPLRKFLY